MINPIDKLLLQSGGVGILHDEAIFDLIENLEEARKMPKVFKMTYARFALRTINAVIPFLDTRVDLFMELCGFGDYEGIKGFEMLFCAGKYQNETNTTILRKFIHEIGSGTHPEKAKIIYKMSNDEFLIYSELLHLEEYWHDEIMDRVLFVIENKGSFFDVMKELNTKNLFVTWTWYRMAKKLINSIK